jgi:hypothetical protein
VKPLVVIELTATVIAVGRGIDTIVTLAVADDEPTEFDATTTTV